MKLLFSLEDEIHLFKVQEAMDTSDCHVLKESLFRFFETSPHYTVLDLSEANIQVPEALLQKTLSEIHTFAQARNLNLTLALSPAEASSSKQSVLETALQKQVEILQAKLELRNKMKLQADALFAENANLKSSVSDHLEQLKDRMPPPSPLLSPLFEKLWSEK